MMPYDTMAKSRPSREVREDRARAFWQAQINEGGRGPPSTRTEPINRPRRRQNHHPRRRLRRAFLCT